MTCEPHARREAEEELAAERAAALDAVDQFTSTLERLAPGTEVPAASVAADLRRLGVGEAR